MIVYRPGFSPVYVDENPPAADEPKEAVAVAESSPLPSVEEAMRLAQARHTGEVINYPIGEAPLIDNTTAVIDPGVNPSAALENPQAPVDAPVVESKVDVAADERAALLKRLAELDGPPVPVDVLNIPTPAEGVLSPASVPADEVNAGKVTVDNTVIGVNVDELLK